MNSTINVLANFNSIVEYMAESINEKFIKVQRACKKFSPSMRLFAALYDKDGNRTSYCPLFFDERDSQWYADWQEEYYQVDLPGDKLKDTLNNIEIGSLKKFYSIYRIDIEDEKRNVILTVRV